MAEVRAAERDRKHNILCVKERRHESWSEKAYRWQQAYMGINQAHWRC